MMKKTLLPALALGTSLVLYGAESAAEPRWYVFGGVTGTKLESDGLQEAALSEGIAASDEVSDTAFGFQVGAGVMITDIFGVELKYSDSGDGEDDVFFTDGIDIVPASIDLSIDGVTLYGVAAFPIAESWDVFGKLGYTLQDAELSADIFGFGVSESEDDDGVAVAGGLRYRITPNWAITGEVEYFAVDFGGFEEPLRGSVNLQYLFTGRK